MTRILDLGPRGEVSYPPAKETRWGRDYGPRPGGEIDRPFADEYPAPGRVLDGRSRWGSRPVGDAERKFEPGRVAETGFFHFAWARLKRAAGHGG